MDRVAEFGVDDAIDRVGFDDEPDGERRGDEVKRRGDPLMAGERGEALTPPSLEELETDGKNLASSRAAGFTALFCFLALARTTLAGEARRLRAAVVFLGREESSAFGL